jgi:hypothetical protein
MGGIMDDWLLRDSDRVHVNFLNFKEGLETVAANILALERESEGLIGEILGLEQ